MKALHIKKGDIVVVLAGEEKGKTGKVLAAIPQKRRVIIEGINVAKKAIRKSQDNPKGGIITKEMPLPSAKVMRQDRWDARKKRRAGTVAAPAA